MLSSLARNNGFCPAAPPGRTQGTLEKPVLLSLAQSCPVLFSLGLERLVLLSLARLWAALLSLGGKRPRPSLGVPPPG